MARGAEAVLADGDVARLGDVRTDLRPGQHPAEPRLRALAQLDLDGLHRRGRDEVHELGQVEAPVAVPAPEIGRADLEDEVAAVAVVLRQPALARVLHAPGE